MQIIENKKINEKLYIEKLENGLTVMVVPKPGVKKKYIIWGTNYGSIDNKFIVPGEENITEVPDGVAHFLEHKMFEQEGKPNSLDVLSSLGVNANAYTTNDHTAYLYECTENFYEALDEFMDYVQHPYFTDENVEKEKGIIIQEINMYQDYPEYILYMNAIKAMYKESPVRIDIAGTEETVRKIDKDILYKCYNTFYNPSNMAMVITGDFEPEEIIEEVKSRLIDKKGTSEIKRIYPEEPKEIMQKSIETKMDISMPLFMIAFKQSEKLSKDIIKKTIGIEIILNILVGKSSNLYKKLYSEGIISAEMGFDYECTRNYGHLIIQGQTTDPTVVVNSFKNELEKLKKEGLNEEDFMRTKKSIYGSYIKIFNNVQEISTMFLADYFKGVNSLDYLEEYKTVTKEYTEELIKNMFNEDKMVISTVLPKN